MAEDSAGPRGSIGGQAIILAELMQLALEPLLAEEGLSVSTFDMLSAISKGNGQSTHAQVAAILRVSAPTLSEAVKAAVEHGFVTQTDDPSDKRLRRLGLTPRSQKIVSRAMARLREVEKVIRKDLTEQEIAALLVAMPKAMRSLAIFVNAE